VNTEAYRLMDYPLEINEWEFIQSLMFLKFPEKINVMEVGEGNISLLYGICTALEKKLKSCYSIDVKKRKEEDPQLRMQKKSVISVVQNRGCPKSVAVEESLSNSCLLDDVLKNMGKDEKIDLLIIEPLENTKDSSEFFQKYNHLFNENMVIYYHNLKKYETSEKLFDNLAKYRKSVKIVQEQGIGIILD